MTGDFVRRGEIQSGQRFLDSSAPRLIRHAASHKPAAGEFSTPTAGKDKKLSPGAGQSPATLSRRGAPGRVYSRAMRGSWISVARPRNSHCSIGGSRPNKGSFFITPPEPTRTRVAGLITRWPVPDQENRCTRVITSSAEGMHCGTSGYAQQRPLARAARLIFLACRTTEQLKQHDVARRVA